MDSRFHLKVKFSIYGKDYDWDCSLNWFAEPGEIDKRIADWFIERHDLAKSNWEAANYKSRQERLEQELQAQELELLKHLKQKYPNE